MLQFFLFIYRLSQQQNDSEKMEKKIKVLEEELQKQKDYSKKQIDSMDVDRNLFKKDQERLKTMEIELKEKNNDHSKHVEKVHFFITSIILTYFLDKYKLTR